MGRLEARATDRSLFARRADQDKVAAPSAQHRASATSLPDEAPVLGAVWRPFACRVFIVGLECPAVGHGAPVQSGLVRRALRK
jgi:hypothetical protein